MLRLSPHTLVPSLLFLVLLAACAPQSQVEQKKAELKEKKDELQTLQSDIETLKQEIAELDPEFAKKLRKTNLVSTLQVERRPFSHFIEVTGEVTSRRNVQITSELPGRIVEVNVEEGDRVKADQVLFKINDDSYREQAAELRTRLELAETLYERQKRLWDQGIGSEVQFLQQKNNFESLKRSLAQVETQIDKTTISAPFSGLVDAVYAKEGEYAQPGMPLLRIVGESNMYLTAEVSENYIGNFSEGAEVIAEFPSLDTSARARVTAIGGVINQSNRTFTIEANFTGWRPRLKPNQVALVRIKDFYQDSALVVPTNLILKDKEGDFVYVVKRGSEGKHQAAKAHIQRGLAYGAYTQVKSGLQGQELLINEGFKEVVNGSLLRLASESAPADQTASAAATQSEADRPQ